MMYEFEKKEYGNGNRGRVGFDFSKVWGGRAILFIYSFFLFSFSFLVKHLWMRIEPRLSSGRLWLCSL